MEIVREKTRIEEILLEVLELLGEAEGSEALRRNLREGPRRGCPGNQNAGDKGGPGCRAGR